MARISGVTIIQQKIADLTKQITRYEQCIQTAQNHITTLKQALIAIDNDPFLLSAKRTNKVKS